MRIIDISFVYTIAIEIEEMKIRDAIKIIEQDGWFMVRREGRSKK